MTWRARCRVENDGDRLLAVKQLRRPPGAGPDWPSPADRQRWQDHRILLRSLRIPHLVPVLDVFLAAEPGDRRDGPLVPYVVMPWVRGPTLVEKVGGVPVTARNLAERLALIRDLAAVVGALRSHSLLHGDVKPGNCVVDPAEGLTLVDLGSLRLLTDTADERGMHTAGYAAPEVLHDPCGPRGAPSDVYSLGAVAHYCLVGDGPPPASVPDTGRAELAAAVAELHLSDADALVDHLRTALDPDPAARPTDPVAWAERLTALAARPRRRRRWRVPAAVATVLALAVGYCCVERRRPAAPYSYATGYARITSPRPGQYVQGCQAFTGTSHLATDRTLVLTRRLASGGDGTRWVQPVENWDEPDRLRAWHGFQFFGDASAAGSARSEFVVELFAGDRASMRAADRRFVDAGEKWRITAIPAGWVLAAAVTVRRVPGSRRC